MQQMNIQRCTVGTWKENAYSITFNHVTILVDPGDDFPVLDDTFTKEHTKYAYIVNTHGHFDHVGAVEDFKVKYNIPFFLHPGDKTVLRQTNLYRKITGQTTVVKTPAVDRYLENNDQLDIGGEIVRVYHTPGHSDGSVCLSVGNNLFSGDIIFENAVGRTDLPGGNPDLLKKSILFVLDRFKGFSVSPGHGDPFVLDDTTIARIRELIL